jgi:hypothetical protein
MSACSRPAPPSPARPTERLNEKTEPERGLLHV